MQCKTFTLHDQLPIVAKYSSLLEVAIMDYLCNFNECGSLSPCVSKTTTRFRSGGIHLQPEYSYVILTAVLVVLELVWLAVKADYNWRNLTSSDDQVIIAFVI